MRNKFWLATVLSLLTTSSAAAQSTAGLRVIPYQGFITSEGAPSEGSVDLTFRLYDAASGGVALWTETRSVAVSQGRFSTTLGTSTPLPPGTLNATTLFLEIDVYGTSLMGRQQILMVATPATPSGIPAGMILPYAGGPIPNGWLACDGSAVSSAEYPYLFAAIGETWGNGGDGSGPAFSLPDFRGRFLRGVDEGTGRDPQAASRVASGAGGNTGDAVGTVQNDAFQGHRHNRSNHTTATQNIHPNGSVEWISASNNGNAGLRDEYNLTTISVLDPTTGVHGTPKLSTETRPVNVSVRFLIKF